MNLKEIINNISFSKNTASKTIWLGIFLLIISILILIVGLVYLNVKLNGDNLTYIVSGLFLSGLALILFPLYFQNNIDKIIIPEKIKEINNNKIEFLENLKEITNKKFKGDEKYLKKFSTTRVSGNYKEIYRGDDFNLRVWLEDDDFGRFYIVPKNSGKIGKYSNFIESKEEGEDNIYTYKETFCGKYDDLEKQIDNIMKDLKIGK